MYEQLDLLSSYKRRYKHLKFVFILFFSFDSLLFIFSSLIVQGNDEQPTYRQSILKQVFDLYKRGGNTTQQEHFLQDIEHVPFDGLTDLFKSATRG